MLVMINEKKKDGVYLVFFFFQAEDGIRDHCVTGVQTCALPIYVPITSATNLFWEEVSLAAILSLEAFSNFSNSSFYLVSNLSDLLNRLTFWVFNSPINDVVYEKHWTFRPLYAAHVYGFCRSLNHILCNQLGFLTADIDSSF